MLFECWASVADSDTTLNQQRDKSMCVMCTLNAIPFDQQIYIYLKLKKLTEDFWNLQMKMKWNESGFRPPLCTYRLNWARKTSWGWWDDWDDTVIQTQDLKFEPWWSEAEHATSRSRRLPTILTFTRGWGRNIFCFFQTAETGNQTLNSGVKGSGANHYPIGPPPSEICSLKSEVSN